MEAGKEAYVRDQLLERRQRLQAAVPRFPDNTPLLRLLQEVDFALDSIKRGSYGICQYCRDPIEEDRLLQNPLLRFCLDHLSPQEQRALQYDLDLAATIQKGLLPKQDLQIGNWQVSYHYEALGPVSGDYCDVISTPGGDLLFLLGDVSGKGVAASILMSHLHAIFRSLMSVGLPFDQLMERGNHLFCESAAASSYATLVCGRATSSGTVEICNAGHLPPLLIRSECAQKLDATGLPLGLFCSSPYGVQKLKLEPGESLFLYTDGLTEACGATNDEYGAARLASLIAAHHKCSARELVETCLKDLESHLAGQQKTDDLALMAVRLTSE